MTDLEVCEQCLQAGMRAPKRRKPITAEELLAVAKTRRKQGLDPLTRMDMVQVNTLARMYKPPFSTYGRFREYVRLTGELPPDEYLRGGCDLA